MHQSVIFIYFIVTWKKMIMLEEKLIIKVGRDLTTKIKLPLRYPPLKKKIGKALSKTSLETRNFTFL